MESVSIIGAIILIFLLQFHTSSCMECQLGHESTLIEKLDFVNPKSCPTFLDSNDKQYCCVDNNRVFCCDAAQFFGNGFGVLLPVLIVVAVGFLIVCCLCCLCCPCCLLYKRRHRGTVYGRVQTTVVTVPQQPTPVYPPQPMPGACPVYPPQPGQQPPAYSEVSAPVHQGYTKQTPYNPSFQ